MVQTWWWKVCDHVEDDENKEDGPKQVGPNVDSLIVDHEERAGAVPIGVEEYAVSTFDTPLMALVENRKVWVVKIPDIRLSVAAFTPFSL